MINKNIQYIFFFIIFYACDGAYHKSKTKDDTWDAQLGLLQYDTIPNNLKTHTLKEGSNFVFTYKRSGHTAVDFNDFDAKYYEYIIFEIDSAYSNLNYCDSSIKILNCKYYWICYGKEILKESRDIQKGCITFGKNANSPELQINVEVDFGFGSFLERKKKRKFNVSKSFLAPLSEACPSKR